MTNIHIIFKPLFNQPLKLHGFLLYYECFIHLYLINGLKDKFQSTATPAIIIVMDTCNTRGITSASGRLLIHLFYCRYLSPMRRAWGHVGKTKYFYQESETWNCKCSKTIKKKLRFRCSLLTFRKTRFYSKLAVCRGFHCVRFFILFYYTSGSDNNEHIKNKQFSAVVPQLCANLRTLRLIIFIYIEDTYA